MHIKITSDPTITEHEVNAIVAEEQQLFAEQNKVLAEIEIGVRNDEIVIKSYEASPIRRVRRITGYLSEEHNFNIAKQAELQNRVTHSYS